MFDACSNSATSFASCRREYKSTRIRYVYVWTYVVGYVDGPPNVVKIGHTVNLEQRIAGLATASPWELYLVRAWPDHREKILHAMLASYRMRGEWFELPDSVMYRIRRNLLNVPFAHLAGVQLTYRGSVTQKDLAV